MSKSVLWSMADVLTTSTCMLLSNNFLKIRVHCKLESSMQFSVMLSSNIVSIVPTIHVVFRP